MLKLHFYIICELSLFAAMCSYVGATFPTGSLTPQVKGLNSANRQYIIDLHNQYRADLARGKIGSQPAAADMTALSWDDRIELGAQQWADQCNAGPHNTGKDRALKPFSSVGQNYAGHSLRTKILAYQVKAWWDEQKQYRYTTAYSSSAGHYTQMAWAKTHFLGCGFDSCKTAKFARLICNYGIGGNMMGEAPYIKGSPCSKCPSGYGMCMAGALCATAEQCKGSISTCKCLINAAACKQHGEYDKANCDCKCHNGWKGLNCDVACVDTSSAFLCRSQVKNCKPTSKYHSWLMKVCQKSCGWCTPTPDNNESNRHGIKVNAKMSGGGSASTASNSAGHAAPAKKTARHKKLYESTPVASSHCRKRLSVSKCNGYKRYCYDARWKHYLKNNCCDNCGSKAAKKSSCSNRHGNSYCNGRKVYCTNYHWKRWMKKFCCKTCKG